MIHIIIALLFAFIVAFPSASSAQERKPNDPSIDLLNVRKLNASPPQFEIPLLLTIKLLSAHQPYRSTRSSIGNMPFEVKGLHGPLWPSNPFSIQFAIAKGYYKKQGFPRPDCWP
jgi:hypothetical protein